MTTKLITICAVGLLAAARLTAADPADTAEPAAVGATNQVAGDAGTNQASATAKAGTMSDQDAADEAKRKAALAEMAKKLAAEPKETKTDFGSFRLIQTRNIFDPYRRPPRTAGPPPVQVDYFTLYGTSSYDDKSIAIFDGSNRQYRRTFKVGESIAGYKIARINYDSVDLETGNGTNTIVMPMMAQMRRENRGPWNLAVKALPMGSSGSDGSASPAAISGAVDEVTRRLMEKHNADMGK